MHNDDTALDDFDLRILARYQHDTQVPARAIAEAVGLSTAAVQRRLKVGYARAARILDLLEQEGFIGPADGAKPRDILKVEFTKGMDQAPVPQAPISHPALEQVNQEIPDIEDEGAEA